MKICYFRAAGGGVWTERMASERQNKYMWHQLYSLKVKLKSGRTVSAIADINCSSDPDLNMGPIVHAVEVGQHGTVAGITANVEWPDSYRVGTWIRRVRAGLLESSICLS